MKKSVFIFLLFSYSTFRLSGQVQIIKSDMEQVYSTYKEQVSSLLTTRGVPPDEIKEMLKVFNEENISSDEQFAGLLEKLYPDNMGYGFLFFFYHNDSLRRVFFEPGRVIETKVFAVTQTEIRQLSIDLNHTLGLYKLSNNRKPVERGIKPKIPPVTEKSSYQAVIQKATNLLIPDSFTEATRHLFIIPALNIGTFPFYLLKPFGNNDELVDHCSVTIVPGILDLLALRIKTIRKIVRTTVEFKNPFKDNYQIEGLYEFKNKFSIDHALFISNPDYPENGQFDFPDLPGAVREVDSAITQIENYKRLDGSQVIKDSVIAYLKRSDLAYFATHGIADEEKPMENSFLVLSGQDPYLTAKNIMDLRNSREFRNRFPEMVILSACQTGLGKNMEAGVAGLSRSFLLAGAEQVIMSLWNVDDNATAYLMNRFLFHLKETQLITAFPAEPLRKACIDAREKFKNPTLWASFSVFGISY